MPQQKLKIYQHAIIWSSGEVSIGGGLAPNEAVAMGLAVLQALRSDNPPAADAQPTGLHVIELSSDWVWQALHAIETGQAQPSNVLSLVKSPDPGAPPLPGAAAAEGTGTLSPMPATTEEPAWTDYLRRHQQAWTPEQEPEPPAAA